MKKFILIPFQQTPYNQPFRYKKSWWRKIYKFGGGGERMKKFTDNINDESNILEKEIVLIEKNELVATEDSFLVLYTQKHILTEND